MSTSDRIELVEYRSYEWSVCEKAGAYYDTKTHKIHVLAPELLYAFVVQHERIHAFQMRHWFFRIWYSFFPVGFERRANREAWKALQ